jgi:hypothetical protein
VLIRPFIPNRYAVIFEILNVGVAPQKPEQFVDDRFDVQLLRREQWEVFPQIETRLCTKDRQCAGAGAIGARLTLLADKAEKIMILAHARNYRSDDVRQSKKAL